MENFVSQYGAWFAIAYIILKEAIIPIFRKTIPAKVKSEIKNETEAQKHAFIIEQKKLDAELETHKRLADNIGESTKAIVAQTEVLRNVLSEMKSIREDNREILSRLPKPRKAAK